MSSHAGQIDHHHDPTTSTGIPNKKLLLWAFLASDCMFFGTLISTHLVYRQHPPPGTHSPREVFDISLTSFSTFILLMSSLMMALAVNAIQRSNVRAARSSILVTAFFGLIFLGCQVFEFTTFYYEHGMSLANASSIFDATFFTLTGTHGTHVAIGVLWLGLMYVRSFKPAGAGGSAWLVRHFAHALVFAAASGLMFVFIVPGVLHIFISGHKVGDFLSHNALALAGEAVALVLLWLFARPRGPVDFDERHAIDVESMGLYWHFVDIVWIVIFTAVYLLEYV
jgi:cytochrome o ubiquinol oxidase subunit 3